MRDWTGGPWQMIEDSRARQFASAVDYFLRDVSRGFGRITLGQIPDGSGNPIPAGPGGVVLDDYLFLPGRIGGQVVHSVDAYPATTFDSLTAGFTGTFGSIGNPIVRFTYGGTALADLRPYLFDTTPHPDQVELLFTAGTAPGVTPVLGAPVNFLSNDGTTAFRIASTTNRTFLQCGLRFSDAVVQNANMTMGGAGARVGDSFAMEFQRLNISNTTALNSSGSASTAKTTRVGINIRTDEYSGSTDANKAKSLHIGDHGGSPGATDPAPFIIENSNGTTDRRLFELRLPSTVSLPTSSTLGAQALSMAIGASSSGNDNSNGKIQLWAGGTLRATITSAANAGSSANDRITFQDNAGTLNLQLEKSTVLWSDDITGAILESPTSIMYCTNGGAALTRYGISATSTMLGPFNPFTATAPTGSRILTVVDSSATVLSGFSSVGKYFLVSGAATGALLMSDSAGVGSWATTLTGAYTFTATLGAGAAAPVIQWPNDSSTGFLTIDDTGGNTVTFAITGTVSGGVAMNFPSAGGTAVTTTASQTLSNKRISSGSVNLTGQTSAIGTTSISISPSATGLYTVEVYAMCTTVSGSGAPTLDVTIGWTDTVGATTTTLVAADCGSKSFPLSLSGTGRAWGRVLVNRASGNITYATTINAASGTPQYALTIKVLG